MRKGQRTLIVGGSVTVLTAGLQFTSMDSTASLHTNRYKNKNWPNNIKIQPKQVQMFNKTLKIAKEANILPNLDTLNEFYDAQLQLTVNYGL